MHTIIEQINSTGKGFVDFAWPMLLQSSALIAVLLLVDILLRRKVRAVFRYWLWMLIIIKLVLPTSLSSPVSVGQLIGEQVAAINISASKQPVGGAVLPSPVATEASESLLYVPSPVSANIQPIVPTAHPIRPAVSLAWQGGVLLVWLAVVIAMILLLLQRAMFVCGLVRQSKEANDLMNDILRFCSRAMGVKKTIGLRISPNATSPAVCGLFRPVILLPHGVGSNFGSNQLKVVLMHELAHIKRGDLWVNLAQTLLQIVYFYNPLLWLANWVIRRVREQAVDEAVQVALGEKAQQYPETLLNVARLAFERPALSLRLVGVVESKSALAGRIKRMLTRPIPRTAKLGIIGLVAVIFLAAVLLPMAKAEKPVISAAEFGDTNGANAEKENRMSKPRRTGPPVVVKTTPVTYANDVSPDLNNLTVTFNQRMADKSWSWVQWDAPYPETTGSPYYDNAKRTCTLPVKLEPGKAYLVAFNIEPYIGFVNTAGEPARPYVLVFATKGKDGKPTLIPEELLAKAKSVNERAPEPEKETSGTESVPYTQIMYDDIRPDGTILFKSTSRQVNRTGREISRTSFINSKFVNVTAMNDDAGRALKFTTKDEGEHWKYDVVFNKPVRPGEVMEYSHEGQLTGLISKAPGAEKEYIYHFRHWPSASEETRRVETFLLPAGAELISTTPKDMERRTRDGRIELHVEKMIPAGGSITTSFRYRLASEGSLPGEHSAIQSKGEQIIKKMAEVNRYWLIGPAAEVKSYSYDFALYQDEPHTYKVTEPLSAGRTIRQGITYDSILHKLATEPSAAKYTAIEEDDGTIKLDFGLTDSRVSIGNGIEKGWRGYFSRKIDKGTFWIDAEKMIPVRADCNNLYEYFSDYAAADETHYVPLKIKIDDDDMHFDWTFKLHKPGLWLFDHSDYRLDEEGSEPKKYEFAASISNVRINGKLSDQSSVASVDVNKPRVVLVWPEDGAMEVEPATEIRIRFDRPMNPEQTNFRWKEGQYRNIGSIRYDATLREFVIPVELEAGCRHRIIANEWSAFREQRQKGFVSVDGMDAGEFEWGFSTKGAVTAADAPKPKVISVSPASGSKIASVSELKIVFDQPISAQKFKLGLPGTETKSSWPRGPQSLRQNVRYSADKTEFTVPLTLPPDWDGTIELSGFVSATGAEAEPIVLRYSTGRELFSPDISERLAKAAKSRELIDILQAVRKTRSNIKSLSETVHTVWDFGKDGKTIRAIFKMQGDKQFLTDITDQMGHPFLVGSDGQSCWFYHKGKQEGLVTVPFEQVRDKYVSICDYARIFELGITGAIKECTLEYFGEDVLDGRKCHLIRSWGFSLENDCVWGSVKIGWIDAETNMLAQVIDDGGLTSSMQRFCYDRINELIPDSEFSPKSFTDIEPSEPEPLNDKYDTRILGIVDGSSGIMKVYWGVKGPGGTSSSGLN